MVALKKTFYSAIKILALSIPLILSSCGITSQAVLDRQIAPENYIVNVLYEDNSSGSYSLLESTLAELEEDNIGAAVSVSPNSLDEQTAGLLMNYASKNPELIEIGLIDEDYFNIVENKMIDLTESQSEVALRLYDQGNSITLYPTTMISNQQIDLDDSNLLLENGIKTVITDSDYEIHINPIDKGFSIIPSVIIDGSYMIQDIEVGNQTFAVSFDIDDILRNQGENSNLYIASAIDYLDALPEEINTLRPVDIYFMNGGRQNIIIRFDDLMMGFYESQFIDIVKATYNELGHVPMNVSVVPFASDDLRSNGLRSSEQITQFIRHFPGIEIGVHGYSVDNPEYGRSAQEQKEVMLGYVGYLQENFMRDMYVLVPPLGVITEDTPKIMAETRNSGDTNLTIISSYWPTTSHNIPIGQDRYGNYHPAPTIDPINWEVVDEEGFPQVRELDKVLLQMGILDGKSTQATTLVLNLHPYAHRYTEGIEYLRDLISSLPPNILYTGFTDSPGFNAYQQLNSGQ